MISHYKYFLHRNYIIERFSFTPVWRRKYSDLLFEWNNFLPIHIGELIMSEFFLSEREKMVFFFVRKRSTYIILCNNRQTLRLNVIILPLLLTFIRCHPKRTRHRDETQTRQALSTTRCCTKNCFMTKHIVLICPKLFSAYCIYGTRRRRETWRLITLAKLTTGI